MVPPMVRLSLVTLVSLSLAACAQVESGAPAPETRPSDGGLSRPVIIGGAVALSSILLLLAQNTATVSPR